jgi:hypothetical protein
MQRQFGCAPLVTGVGEDLIHAAAEHHVAAEEQGHHVPGHGSTLNRAKPARKRPGPSTAVHGLT